MALKQRPMPPIMGIIIALLITAAVHQNAQSRAIPASDAAIWPISGSVIQDGPFSSAYGPRLKTGSGYRYDFHQGLDIGTPNGTPLRAVLPGTVRIAGSHPSYQDGVVQLDHGNGLYSNYLHISQALVTLGETVEQGDAIALSGISESGFPHLHFEFREGGVQSKYAINPFRYLPYSDTIRHTVAISEIQLGRAVWVNVSVPRTELDLAQVRVVVRDAANATVLDQQTLDYEARNAKYDGKTSILDQPYLDNILISPQRFTSTSPEYGVDVLFRHLRGSGTVWIEACAIDINANAVCSQQQGLFGNPVFLPTIR